MAGATTSTTSNAVRTYVAGLVDTADYDGTPLRDITQEIPSQGDTSYRWNIKYGHNASSVDYNEGDALTAPGNTLTARAAVAYSTGYTRTVFSLTGHAKDAAKNGYWDLMEVEAADALQAHMHAKEGKLVTALEAAIDSAGSYAGLLRSTYKLASTEAASSTLTLAELQTEWETMAKIENATNMGNVIKISTIDMINEYADVANGIAYFENLTLPGVIDAGKLGNVIRYNNRPWIEVPTMTATTILTFDPSHVKRVVHRPVTIREVPTSKDEQEFAIESCEIIIHENPRKAGKIT
jgi:hypothetical protein